MSTYMWLSNFKTIECNSQNMDATPASTVDLVISNIRYIKYGNIEYFRKRN